MKIENRYNELVITIPLGVVDILEVQIFLDYLNYKLLVAKSQATDQDIEAISAEINASWFEKYNNQIQ